MSSYFTEYDHFGSYSPPSPAAPATHPFHDNDDGYFVTATALNSPPPPIYVSDGGLTSDPPYFPSETNANGPILPEMERDDGYALGEWRRLNIIRLEEKIKREKELLNQIIREADDYKIEFHKKWQLNCETNKTINREKEKAYIRGQKIFHSEADKDYWKSITDLIPKEVTIVKAKTIKGVEKEEDKKPKIQIIQGPKPGKPTNLTRMRQLLVKLKHDTPPHLKLANSPTPKPKTDSAVVE